MIERDPDFDDGVSWCASRAKIVDVEEVNVSLDLYEVCQRVGPHCSWTDGSPVYTSTGRYLPSPEQLTQMRPEALEAISAGTIPWTPVEFINAWIAGRPAGDRPDLAKTSKVMLGAAEGGRVAANHRERATLLMRRGVKFTNDFRAQLVAINGLLPLAGTAVLRPQ
ncbi:MAG: hypothetical protein ACRCSN_12390 [Dermatophilaceae bacterium]